MKTIYTLLTALFIFTSISSKAQTCEAPEGQNELDINNVRAHIQNGLQHFEDNGNSAYQVPNPDGDIGPRSIYAEGLWIGGYDGNGSLHLAATTYRVGGSEFYAGPLQNTGLPSANSAMCAQHDAVYRVNRADVLLHQQYFLRVEAVADGADPSILTEPPFEGGYVIPEYFYDWPAINNTPDYDLFLAPFYDFNADGLYNPDDGDYPYYDVLGDSNCEEQVGSPGPLKGHQATWYVSNDLGVHSESGGEPMGIELQVMNYAFATDDALNNTTFVEYTLINRSQNTYTDCVVSKWVDFDLGCYEDDFIGTDVARGMTYVYNGDMDDEDCGPVSGYGTELAAQGVILLNGPYQDSDGDDNPITTDALEASNLGGIVYSGQGQGYGDGLVDNERLGIGSSVAYARNDQTTTPSVNGEPDIALEYMSFMNGTWKNGESVTYGGNGVLGSLSTRYMFPGLSDPLGAGTNGAVLNGEWSEGSVGNTPSDRRILLNTAPFTMEPGEVNVITYAYVWTRDESGDTDAQDLLFATADEVIAQYEDCFSQVPGQVLGLYDENELAFSLAPNPAQDYLSLSLARHDASITDIRVVDLRGQAVLTIPATAQNISHIDISSLNAGYYLVEVNTADGGNGRRAFVKK